MGQKSSRRLAGGALRRNIQEYDPLSIQPHLALAAQPALPSSCRTSMESRPVHTAARTGVLRKLCVGKWHRVILSVLRASSTGRAEEEESCSGQPDRRVSSILLSYKQKKSAFVLHSPGQGKWLGRSAHEALHRPLSKLCCRRFGTRATLRLAELQESLQALPVNISPT